jgi:hypothetical protein
MERRTLAAVVATLALTAILATPTLAVDSSSTSRTDGAVTQTHTLYYNALWCSGQTYAYAFVNWKTRFQRVAGANRDIDYVRFRAFIAGVSGCSGGSYDRDTGISMYGPTFGSKNDITWTQALNWGYVRPVLFGAASSQAGYYTQRGGGPVITRLCTNISMANNGSACSQL